MSLLKERIWEMEAERRKIEGIVMSHWKRWFRLEIRRGRIWIEIASMLINAISLCLFGERGPEFTYSNIIIFAAFLLLEKRDKWQQPSC